MEKWITRTVAALCAAGSTRPVLDLRHLPRVPWRESRMLSLNSIECRYSAIPLIAGLAVAWGALHILAIADRADSPEDLYYALCVALLIASLLAVSGGMSWTAARIA
jgi:hypothetical protein